MMTSWWAADTCDTVQYMSQLRDWAKRTDLSWGQNGVSKDGRYIMFKNVPDVTSLRPSLVAPGPLEP